jgi:hypothetical protein
MEIDISIHNKQKSSFARGEFRVYILRENPMKSTNDFASGLDGMFDGFQLIIEEGTHRNDDTSKGAPVRTH